VFTNLLSLKSLCTLTRKMMTNSSITSLWRPKFLLTGYSQSLRSIQIWWWIRESTRVKTRKKL